MPKLSWLRSLVVPVIILSILFMAFAAYYLYWVPDRQRHLDDRGFRYLKTLSDQIRLTVNTYDKMLDNAVTSGVVDDTNAVTLSNIGKFLQNVAPQLVLPEDTETAHVIGTDFDDPPKISIKADEGTHFIYFAFRHGLERKLKDGTKVLDFAVRADFDRLINRLLGAPDLSPFDVVLISQGDGKVIFQKSLSGIQVSQIKKLADASREVKGQENRQIDIEWLSPASRLEEVWIAGARYRLYSQPLQVGLSLADPTGKHPSVASETWVLCGLVRADRFRSESQLIPYFYILGMLAAILLAAASYPFLKLYLSCPGERLRAREVTLIAVFACFVAAVLTFVLVDVYFWNSSFGPAAERDMATLAHAMNTNFKLEQDAAMSLLDAFNATQEIKEPLEQSRTYSNSNKRVCYYEDVTKRSKCVEGVACDPKWACKVDILTPDKNSKTPDRISKELERYPYSLFAFWSDSDGKQQIKWTTRKRPTSFVSLDDPSVPYYPDVKRALKQQATALPVPTQGIGSQYSPTTGQNITTFWKVDLHPTDLKDTPYEEEKAVTRRYSYSVVTQPISLYNAVLPGGYQFAVLTPDGTVVFHSDPTRNLRENFFAEAIQNPNLQSLVRMRSEGAVTATYIGRPHRMYVVPMDAANQDGLWTIVIFRDLHLEEVLNVEILSLATILFLLYAVVIALVLVAVHRIRKGRAAAWFWPDSGKAGPYRRIALINLVAIVLLLVLSRFVLPLPLLVCAGLIPAASLIFAVVIVGGREDQQVSQDEPDQTTSEKWQSAYFQAAATLVVVIAVLPSLCFFKMAADFGQWLLVKHTLLKLAGDLDSRALALQALYQDVKLGGFEKTILAGPDGQRGRLLAVNDSSTPPIFANSELVKACSSTVAEPTGPSLPVFSYHELLNTCVISDQHPPDGSIGDTSDESSLLGALTYPYNESAADDQHLAKETSDVWKWTSSLAGRDRLLKLTKLSTGARAYGLTRMQTSGKDERNLNSAAQPPAQPVRSITTMWQPFHFQWGHWVWCLGVVLFMTAIYWLVRLSFSRVFLLNFIVPAPLKPLDPELNPATLMVDLPMNLLLIGPDTCSPIASLLRRSDVQIREAEELLQDAFGPAKPAGASAPPTPAADSIDAILRDGRPLVVRHFERVPDNPETASRIHAALMRVLSALGNSVILVSSLDPVLMSSIEANERWRSLLRSLVRIDMHSTPRQRRDEDDADYQSRISVVSYFHWLFAGLPKSEKLVMLQLAEENVVNPSSSEIVYDLMEEGLIERRQGLLAVTEAKFAKFLPHAMPHHTVKLWEKEMAGARPFSLQTSLLIIGVGVVAFLVYTQGDIFNTWVTYATGVASAVPKAMQFFENFQSKMQGKS